MLTQLARTKQQWGGGNTTIDNWLMERQAVLVSFCELIGLSPQEQVEKKLPDNNEVKRFCQLLMDYISAGHFEIFKNIISQCKKNGPADAEKAKAIYPKLNTSTDFALQFNDRFSESGLQDPTNNFDQLLESLGRTLEERFVLEDQLLAMLHKYD